MSEQNDEITLAHDEYISANNINVDKLPAELDQELDKVNALIDIYEADPSDANFEATESASKSLKDKIQKWHEDKKAADAAAEEAKKKQAEAKVEQPQPKPEAPKAPEVVAQPKNEVPEKPVTVPPAQTQTPPAPVNNDVDNGDEGNSWSYSQFLK